MTILASRGQLRASVIRWALLLVPATVLLGTLSGLLSGSGADSAWFATLRKPAIYPPPATFGIVWTILYALMGTAAALICAAAGARKRRSALIAFWLQLALNLAWPPLFFAAQNITAALVLILVLDAAVLATMLLFWRVRWLAAALLLPYLGWILFATVLNWQFLAINPQADGGSAANNVQRIEL